jgi:hypothetical protein
MASPSSTVSVTPASRTRRRSWRMFLPPGVRKPGQEVVEIGVALVAPVELHRSTQQHAMLLERFRVVGKKDVQGRVALRHLQRRRESEAPVVRGSGCRAPA